MVYPCEILRALHIEKTIQIANSQSGHLSLDRVLKELRKLGFDFMNPLSYKHQSQGDRGQKHANKRHEQKHVAPPPAFCLRIFAVKPLNLLRFDIPFETYPAHLSPLIYSICNEISCTRQMDMPLLITDQQGAVRCHVHRHSFNALHGDSLIKRIESGFPGRGQAG